MVRMRATMLGLLAALALALALTPAHAQEPFYKGKRLSVLVNYAPGGPTDIEGRLFARHIGKHIDGQPSIVVQNVEGAGGLIGTTYLGEIAPKDGTMMGYLTGAAGVYANDPEKHRVDLRTYEFLAYQAGTAVYYVRTDTPPGMTNASDLIKAQGLVSGGLAADNSKDLLIRLSLDILGVPFRHVTGYRSNQSARLALQRNEINLFAESPPGYRSVVEPSMVKTGQVIPLYYDPNFNGEALTVPKQIEGLTVPVIPGFLSEGERQTAVRPALGRLPRQPRDQRRDAAAAGAAAPRPAGRRRGAARRHTAAQFRQGIRRRRDEDHGLRPRLRRRASDQRAGAQGPYRPAGNQDVRRQLPQGREEVGGRQHAGRRTVGLSVRARGSGHPVLTQAYVLIWVPAFAGTNGVFNRNQNETLKATFPETLTSSARSCRNACSRACGHAPPAPDRAGSVDRSAA